MVPPLLTTPAAQIKSTSIWDTRTACALPDSLGEILESASPICERGPACSGFGPAALVKEEFCRIVGGHNGTTSFESASVSCSVGISGRFFLGALGFTYGLRNFEQPQFLYVQAAD